MSQNDTTYSVQGILDSCCYCNHMVLLPKNTPDIEYGYNEPEFICEIDRAEITVGNWDAYVCRL
jgi:hypothetical protein